MATFKNPAALAGKAIPTEAGQVKINRDVFDFANTGYRPAALAIADRILLGVVPAGCKLVTHLSSFQLPIIDAGGAPTGQASIGTNTTPAALKATGAVNAAQRLSGEDLLPVDVGARFEDVPVYAVFTAAAQTAATVGKILADLVIRPYDSSVDTDVT